MQICRFRVGFFVKPHNPAPQRIRWGEGGRSHATTHRTTDAAGLEPRDECAGCPGAQMNEQTGSGSAAADSLTPEKLLELIRDERADSALYAHLASRMKGRAQAMLREMARQEACTRSSSARSISSRPAKRPVPQAGCAVRHLHQRNASASSYSEEHAAHEAYEALAENAGTHRCMLLKIAEEECGHAQMILCILQTCL